MSNLRKNAKKTAFITYFFIKYVRILLILRALICAVKIKQITVYVIREREEVYRSQRDC